MHCSICVVYFQHRLRFSLATLLLTFSCLEHLSLLLTSSISCSVPPSSTQAFNFALLSPLLLHFSSHHFCSPLIAHFSLCDCVLSSPPPPPSAPGVKIQCHSYIISYNCLGDYSTVCHKTLFSRKQKATAGEGDGAWLIVV